MFGWEFPPHISGGLGTACLGLTKELANLLRQVDIRVLDHFVVCARNTVSLAARGLI